MRVIKAIVLFCFSMGMVSACFEAPEMSSIPRITFNSLKFKEVGTIADFDTLVITFNFQDGNGDLGLDPSFPPHNQPPFHSAVYYVGNGLGDTTRIISSKILTYDVLTESNPPAFPGKLVTGFTRTQNPAYTYLPFYSTTEECGFNYTKDDLYVQSTLNLVDVTTHNIVDTLYEVTLKNTQPNAGELRFVGTVIPNDHQPTGRVFYRVNDPLLYKANPYHNNIEVKFYKFVLGTYVEYDFFKELCISYDGRFPVLIFSEKATEGVFRYAIGNSSFVSIFGSESWRITVRIRDRALNNSNLMVYDFELDDIR